LRSTRIRTLDRTVITIPNGRLSEMRLEGYSPRDRIRLACNLALDYATTAGQMREVLADCERVLREQPKIYPDDVTVRFKELGETALAVEVQDWFVTNRFAEFQRIREDVLLSFMAAVERAGTRFALQNLALCLVPHGGLAGSPKG
jgi:MscS family membrane protein